MPELFEKLSGKKVFVKTAMDKKEYLDSGFYVETFGSIQEIEDAEFVEVKDEVSEELKSEALDLKSQINEEVKAAEIEAGSVDLTTLSLDELQDIHKDLYGTKKRGTVSDQTLIDSIEAKWNAEAK